MAVIAGFSRGDDSQQQFLQILFTAMLVSPTGTERTRQSFTPNCSTSKPSSASFLDHSITLEAAAGPSSRCRGTRSG